MSESKNTEIDEKYADVYPYPTAVECPYPHFNRMREEAPVEKIPGQDMYFIARRKDVEFAFDNTEIISNIARNGGSLEAQVLDSGVELRTLLDSDPPTQGAHKSLVRKYFGLRLFKDNEPAMRALINELIDDFIDDGKVNFVSQFADRVPEVAIAHLLQLPGDVRAKITEWGRLETSGVRFFSGERRKQQEKVLESLDKYSREMVIERHKNLGDDVLSNLIRAQIERDGKFEPEYTKATLAVLITAGLLTTALMIAHAMRLLIEHPEQMQLVVNDHSLIPNMLEEALRYESPAQWIPKRVAQDVELAGTHMSANHHVCLGLASANREESLFPDPDKFDILRKNAAEHIAFGRGVHFCLGAPLAKLEGKIAFELLFSRAKNWRFGPDNDFTHIDSPSFRGLKKLNLEFDKI